MDHPPKIETAELKKQIDAGTARVVEVSMPRPYDEGHIPGAIHIHFATIGRKAADNFSKDDTIVTYCKDERCRASLIAAQKLLSLGYRNTYHYEGGKQAWIEAGHPLEVSETPTE